MNPQSIDIQGEEFFFKKVIRKRGQIKGYLYRSAVDGTPAYMSSLPKEQSRSPLEGFMYKPFVLKTIAICMFFIRR